MDKQLIDKSKTYKELLNNEIEILSECKHARLMKVYDLLEDSQCYYVVSELIEGGSVIARLKSQSKPFTEQITFKIIY